MAASRDLAARFEAYSDWRRRLSGSVLQLHEWLQEQDLADAQVDLRVQQLLERLHQDKRVVAFVADRVARPVRLTLRSGGASVVVHRAHASFVAEAARRWE